MAESSSLPPFGPRLSEAIERLYLTFSAYPEPAGLEGSPYKDVAGMVRSLKAAPLRQLTGDQIGPYAGSAILTVGDVADYKHYLPRILEQAVLKAPHIGVDPPIIADRLKYAGWRDWREEEQAAITHVFVSAWSWAVDQHPGAGANASDWLCGICALEEPVLPILEDWSTRPSVESVLQAAWLRTMFPAGPNEELAYWSYVRPADRRRVLDWLLSPERIDAFKACWAKVDDFDRWDIEQALGVHQQDRRH
jgi:hypothetical protein